MESKISTLEDIKHELSIFALSPIDRELIEKLIEVAYVKGELDCMSEMERKYFTKSEEEA